MQNINKQKIFLIGYPGSGKSTYGKKVAAKLNLPFLDTDKIIANQHSMSIAEIFETHGVGYFREKETEVLEECVNNYDGFVMATGGGVACSEKNIEIMLKNGIVLYLKATAEILYSRIINAKTVRPNHLNDGNLLAKIKEELSEREKYYLQANNIVESKRGCEKEIIYLCTNNLE